jgi:DHA3 family macrolide efflux protein-like MFS transporter
MAALLPQALLAPLGGTLADRYSRRLIMILADTISALCMLVLIGLFLTEWVELWHVYTMMFIRSAMQAFQSPASAASTAMLVPASFLPRAAGLNQALLGIMTVAAAPLSALAISVMPLGFALDVDVVTALLGVISLLVFRIPQELTPAGHRRGLWKEFRAGVCLVWDDPALRRLYGLLGAVILCIMPSFTLVPLLVKEHFAGGADEMAIMEGLTGAGMIVGGMAIAALAPRRPMHWFLWGFALSCFALALTDLAPSHLFWLAVLSWVVCGIAFSVGNRPLMALLQSTVPNHLQGRVLSLRNTAMGLAAPIGLMVAGLLGELIGSRWLFVLMDVLGGGVSLIGFLSPALLRMGASDAR